MHGKRADGCKLSGVEERKQEALVDAQEPRKGVMRRSQTLFFLMILSALTVAAARETAPQFTAHTLGGETFTDDSLRGKVALLQFWTTW